LDDRANLKTMKHHETIKRNDRSTTEGGRRIPLIAINCRTIQVLKSIVVEVEH
jgi:hypothetical protein